jgi:hypothetical protein
MAMVILQQSYLTYGQASIPADATFNQQNYPPFIAAVNQPKATYRTAAHSMQMNNAALPNFKDVLEIHGWSGDIYLGKDWEAGIAWRVYENVTNSYSNQGFLNLPANPANHLKHAEISSVDVAVYSTGNNYQVAVVYSMKSQTHPLINGTYYALFDYASGNLTLVNEIPLSNVECNINIDAINDILDCRTAAVGIVYEEYGSIKVVEGQLDPNLGFTYSSPTVALAAGNPISGPWFTAPDIALSYNPTANLSINTQKIYTYIACNAFGNRVVGFQEDFIDYYNHVGITNGVASYQASGLLDFPRIDAPDFYFSTSEFSIISHFRNGCLDSIVVFNYNAASAPLVSAVAVLNDASLSSGLLNNTDLPVMGLSIAYDNNADLMVAWTVGYNSQCLSSVPIYNFIGNVVFPVVLHLKSFATGISMLNNNYWEVDGTASLIFAPYSAFAFSGDNQNGYHQFSCFSSYNVNDEINVRDVPWAHLNTSTSYKSNHLNTLLSAGNLVNSTNNRMTISPNPINDYVVINNQDKAIVGQYAIYNSLGQVCLKGSFESLAALNTAINQSILNLPKGAYLFNCNVSN